MTIGKLDLGRLDMSRILRDGGIVLSIAIAIGGYFLNDIRNQDRQNTEISSLEVRVTQLEQMEKQNTEGRIRAEEDLKQLKDGIRDIKEILRDNNVIMQQNGVDMRVKRNRKSIEEIK